MATPTTTTGWILHVGSYAGIAGALLGLVGGVQILGPLYEDDTAITFAELLADRTGGFQPPPI
jgi:Asp-tRNA(Asn)/Glu-tRNA(Gln) amidotransferase A subunit family amidase